MSFNYKTNLSAGYVRSLLDYDPETGRFAWKVAKGAAAVGAPAGHFCPEVGLQIRINRELYLGHRLAWLMMTGEWPQEEVDHKDCDRGNNAWRNLREASHAENNQNVGAYKNNKLGLKGVHELPYGDNRYCARIMVNRARYELGKYPTAEQAHNAYVKASEKLHGEFTRASQ